MSIHRADAPSTSRHSNKRLGSESRGLVQVLGRTKCTGMCPISVNKREESEQVYFRHFVGQIDPLIHRGRPLSKSSGVRVRGSFSRDN